MSTKISITTSRECQSIAAASLSDTLNQLHCPHAFIGGFAWALLGSSRPTEMSCIQVFLITILKHHGHIYDIDVLIEVKELSIVELRQKLTDLNKKFASTALKIYFVMAS